jgi:6-phosphogluconolactonase
MLRSIGSVTFLALFMVGCGGGGGGDSGPPPPTTYTVGGTVTGLSGSGLVLQNGGGDDLPISASGAFTFATRMPSGTSYSVTIKTSPAAPHQDCQIANGAGSIVATDVTNVTVTCQTGFKIGGGSVSGLMGSGLVLQLFSGNPDGSKGIVAASDPLQINSNGPFAFYSAYPPNFRLLIRIRQQPVSPTQGCVLQYSADYAYAEVVCSQFAYVANAGDNTVSAYTVDAASGALAAVGTPIETGTSPHAIAGTQDKRYVFVGNEGTNNISAFAVNPASGALTAVPGSPFAAGTDPNALALYQLSGTYTYLYAANEGSDTVSAFAVDTSGSLTPLSPATFATGKGPSSIVVDPTGGFIYVANSGGSNDVSAFAVDPTTGILTPVAGSPFPAGANPRSLALGGKFLFTANPDPTNSSISGFNANGGALTPLTGSPFPLAVSHDIATTGAYLYVTSGTGVVGYGIDGTTGMLTPLPGFPVVTGTDAYSVTLDLVNQFLYVANDGSADVAGFRFDASTGRLTPITGSPFPAGNLPDFVTVF